MSKWFAAVTLFGSMLVIGCGVSEEGPGVDVEVGPGGVKVNTPEANVDVSAARGCASADARHGSEGQRGRGCVTIKASGAEVDTDPEEGVNVKTPDVEVETESTPE